MFSKLTDYSYKRNAKEAVGFYIAYFLLIILFSWLTGVLFGGSDLQANWQLGTKVAVVISTGLSFILLFKKNLKSNFKYILLAILSGILAYYGGGLLGLVPVAYISTR